MCHFCVVAFERVSALPVINLLSVVNHGVQARGYRRVGLVGTRGVMEFQFYGALPGVEALAPVGESLDKVHEAYVTMASAARCIDEQRQTFFNAGRALVEDQGAEAVLLAGTDLGLAFNGFSPDFVVFDCAEAHVQAIAAAAIAL
jgi:aspartate racemase